MVAIIFLLVCQILSLGFFTLFGDSSIIKPIPIQPSSSSYRYHLIDLGSSQHEHSKLSKQSFPLSFAPQINDLRQMIFNDDQQGYIQDHAGRQAAPQLSRMPAHCYALNNAGTLLIALERTPSDWEWLLWQQNKLHHTSHKSIPLIGLEGRNLFFRAINDKGLAVGSFKSQGPFKPAIYTPQDGLHHLGYYLGYDLSGCALAVNNNGLVAGFLQEDGDCIRPFAWNKKCGLMKLKSFKYRWESLLRCTLEGKVHFADLALSDHGLLYVTFWVERPNESEQANEVYYAFWWDPRTDELRPLDLNGMRISEVSSDGATVYGSHQGEAALCDVGRNPVLLKELGGVNALGWDLLEATDVNSYGDIVGFGQLGDHYHYFLLHRDQR